MGPSNTRTLSSPLLFCSSFTPPSSPRPSCRHCSIHPKALRPSLLKRTRVPWRMATVQGGFVPNWPEDGAVEVDYFQTQQEGSTPDSPRATELPLFPLQMVLNPGTPVPLHIFELRYRLLFNRIRDSDSRFGVVFYDSESAALAAVGCAAELTRFDAMPDGRIMTNNIGRQRFRILRIIEEKPYTRAMVEFLSDEVPKQNLTPLMKEVWETLKDVLRLSNKLYDKVLDLSPEIRRLAPDEDADEQEKSAEVKDGEEKGVQEEKGESEEAEGVPEGWPEPQRLEDFSFAVCQALDMPLPEQQILLQTCDTGLRLRRQLKMLQTARQYLAAQVTIKEAGLGKW